MKLDTLARVQPTANLSASSPDVRAAIDRATALMMELPQIDLVTEHMFHGGMYARTVRLVAGSMITGTLLIVPTLLIIHGDVEVFTGEEFERFTGFHVLAGSAGRQSLMVCLSDVEITMVYATKAQSVEIVEAEFTDSPEKLMSRRGSGDMVTVTGE